MVHISYELRGIWKGTRSSPPRQAETFCLRNLPLLPRKAFSQRKTERHGVAARAFLFLLSLSTHVLSLSIDKKGFSVSLVDAVPGVDGVVTSTGGAT